MAMAGLSADQRNDYYLTEAARTGLHKPILAALYAVHRRPKLKDEDGLGISPANRITLEQVSSFPTQVQFAANTVRSITDKLTAQGWKGEDFWDIKQGCYTDRFIQAIAAGYNPSPSDLLAARLEPTDPQTLRESYWADLSRDAQVDVTPSNLDFLDTALTQFVEQIGHYYMGLISQREAVLETLRIWRKLNTRHAAIASLLRLPETDPSLNDLDDTSLDKPLVQFIQSLAPFYAGYPHQREALIRLTQLWRQLGSRGEAITSLAASTSADINIQILDPALVAFAQRIPQDYQRQGEQRHALTEAYRFWQGLESRTAALKDLGIDAQILTASNPNRNALVMAATQLDRALLEFVKRIPIDYQETDSQREALIRLVQLWRRLDGREKAIQSLLDDVRRMERARRDSPDAPPRPEPIPLPPRPAHWTPDNLQLHASIVPNGNFTWAEATHGGTQMPPNQSTVDAIVAVAKLAQQARDRLGRPFRVTRWFDASEGDRTQDTLSQDEAFQRRYRIGDAFDFYCDGLTGDQIYRALDPWWAGGLGRYGRYPALCHIDARGYRVRWVR